MPQVKDVESLLTLWERLASAAQDISKEETAMAAQLVEALRVFWAEREKRFVAEVNGAPLLDVYGADGTPIADQDAREDSPQRPRGTRHP